MKCHRELVVSSKHLDAGGIAREVEQFGADADAWLFPAEKSAKYQELCGEPSCCIVSLRGEAPFAAVHFTKKRDNALYMANIIPLRKSALSLAEYNEVVASSAKLIRASGRKKGTHLSVRLSKQDVALADVIPGRLCKRRFESFLLMHARSYHPLDIRRLDEFTCSLASLKRKPFDLDAFEHLLVEELRWSGQDAKWCRARVEIGLDVLAANKSYWL
mgnify:CR=1 FL=1|jgi:hypothetical protein